MRVLIHNSKTGKNEWHEAESAEKCGATDRDFRYNVTLKDGTYIQGCAPECVELQ